MTSRIGLCKYNKQINCDRHIGCAKCNWNPEYFEWYKKKTRQEARLRKEQQQSDAKGAVKMKITLDEGAVMPTRAHEDDAGLDLYARESQTIHAKSSATFDTGVHIELPKNTVGFLKSKSGLNVKHGITSEGVIDVGFTGSIKVKLYNNSGEDYVVNGGDKISQLVVLPILTPALELVDSLEETERGGSGFGSSGR